jgi:hypothetical protein
MMPRIEYDLGGAQWILTGHGGRYVQFTVARVDGQPMSGSGLSVFVVRNDRASAPASESELREIVRDIARRLAGDQ